MTNPTRTTTAAVYAARKTDAADGADHFVDTEHLTLGDLGDPYIGLCGAAFTAASPLRPHGSVCPACAAERERLHLRAVESAPELAGAA